MKTIGLIGGMTCESSLEYYRIINQLTRQKLGGNHSAKSIMISLDFGVIEPMMDTGKWDEILNILTVEAENIKRAGGDFVVLCTNTMHKFADIIQERINLPLLNIIDVTAEEIKKKNCKRVGLLGTRFTMEQAFYKQRLAQKHGLEVLVPGPADRDYIHRVIVEELSVGIIKSDSREGYRQIMEKLAAEGAEGVILGCTEIPLLVSQKDAEIHVFDTTGIHVQAIVDFALG